MAIIAREKREAARRAAAERAREKASRKKAATNPLQALWDANGAAIYEANQAFKTKYGKNMSTKVRRKAIKDATRNGHFNAGAYAGNLVKAVTLPPPKKEDPYAGIGDWVDRQDKSNAKMLDGASELEKWAALQKQKNAPVDSATASYMAMGAAVEAGKFSKDDYDRAREQAEEEKSWWEKTVDWVDDHQTEISLGIGIAAGVAAIVLSGGAATPLVAAAWVAGSAAVAGGVAATGTVALNNHYGRNWKQGVIRNTGIASTVAFSVGKAPMIYAAGKATVGLAAFNVSMGSLALGASSSVAHAIRVTAPYIGAAWSTWTLASMGAIGYGVSQSADSTLSTEERETGGAIAYAGAQSLESATDVFEVAELVNTMSPFKVQNPVPDELGLHPIMQSAIANSTPDDGSLVAVRAPAQGAEYPSAFGGMQQKPEGAENTPKFPFGEKWPFGIRKISTKTGEDLGWAVSDLDPAWGLDGNGNLLLESDFYNPTNPTDPNTFGGRVNTVLGYDAVQHADQVNGSILHTQDKNVPSYPLFKETIVMDSNGYVSHGSMLETLMQHSPNPDRSMQQLFDALLKK